MSRPSRLTLALVLGLVTFAGGWKGGILLAFVLAALAIDEPRPPGAAARRSRPHP